MISKFVKLFWRKFYLLLVVLLITIICCYKFYINLWHKELNINSNGYILEIFPKQNFKAVLTKLNQDLILSEINKNILTESNDNLNNSVFGNNIRCFEDGNQNENKENSDV